MEAQSSKTASSSLIARRSQLASPLRAGCLTKDGKPGTYIDSFWYRWPERCWSRGQKPLDLGEFGLMRGNFPHAEGAVIGERAYSDPSARDEARAKVWTWQIEAARALDVAMLNPWNLPKGPLTNKAAREAFEPVKLVLRPQSRRFYSGEKMRLSLAVINDRADCIHQPRLSLDFNEKPRREQEKKGLQELGTRTVWPELHSGEVRWITLEQPLPEVAGPRDLTARIELRGRSGSKAKEVLPAEKRLRISLYPQPGTNDWSRLAKLQLFDPGGRTSRLFTRFGILFVQIRDLERSTQDPQVLVLGRNALKACSSREKAFLWERIEAGLPTLILQQETLGLLFPA